MSPRMDWKKMGSTWNFSRLIFGSFPFPIPRLSVNELELERGIDLSVFPAPFNPFWDSFASAVDDNPGLSDVDKLNYLRNLLVGPVEGYRLQQKFTSQISSSMCSCVIKARISRDRTLQWVNIPGSRHHVKNPFTQKKRPESTLRRKYVLNLFKEPQLSTKIKTPKTKE